MKYIWVPHTDHAETLLYLGRSVAWVTITFTHAGGMYRARVKASKEEKLFPTLQQAKDWAQAVILLTQ